MSKEVTQIVGREETLPVIQDQSAMLLSVIERAATNPDVDIDKMERLLAMHERMSKQQAEVAFNVAMNEAQREVSAVKTDQVNDQTRSAYASYKALDKIMRPIYTAHGFSLSFDEADTDKPEHIRVVCYVSHIAGHTRTYHKDIPVDGKGIKGNQMMTKTHASGSGDMYGMRYLLRKIFNIATTEDDDDGNAAGIVFVSDEQQATINDMASHLQPEQKLAFLRWLGASLVSEIRAKDYNKAIDGLRRKLEQKG